MRTVIFSVAASLDLRLATADHDVGWLLWSDEVTELMRSLWQDVDTVLMGRRTYEFALAKGRGGALPGVRTIVFSRTLRHEPDRDGAAEIVAADAAELVRTLRAAPGKDILLMGGGGLARPLLEAGLVDRLRINLHPLLLGAGPPLLPGLGRAVELELRACRQLPHGCVHLDYAVAPRR